MIKSATTRAVVIGVAKFQHERIPPLEFAHRDAIAFADFLQSEAGGGLAAEQYKLLINEQATQGQVAMAFTWLLEETQEGDRAIIYFSGHGDMENQTYSKRGYLLTYDTHPTTYMAGGAFPLTHIHDIIETLRKVKGAEVVLITDACHAGALAGSENKGAQATNFLLAEQTADIKLLSCQPDEFSAEGRQWGGGHGVFTHYLIDGLTGLADRDEDKVVSLFELKRYLEDEVRLAVAPRPQNPNVSGNLSTEMAFVDIVALEQLIDKRRGEPADVSNEIKGLRLKSVRLNQDSIILRLYQAFNVALNRKQLLYPEEGSAYTLYMRLKDEATIAPYQQEMRLQLVAALQEEAQQAINDYLAASPFELRRRWAASPVYLQYPAYLRVAASLLGEQHFMHQDLLTKALYFEGLNDRLAAEKSSEPTELLEKAMQMQKKVLELDSTAAYAYNELGLLARRSSAYDESIGHFDQALAYSPTWVLAIANRCASLVDEEQYEQAMDNCQFALQLDSTFSLAHHNMGATFKAREEWDKAIAAFQKAIDYEPSYALSHSGLGDAYYFSGNKAAAQAAWTKAYSLDSSRLIDLYNTGIVAREQGRAAEAITIFEQYVESDASDYEAYQEIAIAALLLAQTDKARTALAQAKMLKPTSAETYYLLASLEASLDNKAAAITALETARSLGFTDFARLAADPLWQTMRQQPEIKALID